MGFVVVSCDNLKVSIFLASSWLEIGVSSRESRAAPVATKRWASSGIITSFSCNFKVSINLFLSSERYVSGPPRNATLPLIGLPHASPDLHLLMVEYQF